jgi:hypothetical protein
LRFCLSDLVIMKDVPAPSCSSRKRMCSTVSRALELALFMDAKLDVSKAMDKDYLLLKRAALSRPSGEWNDDVFDVLANGEVVGRIFKANAAPVGAPWMWTLSHADARL